MGVWGKVAMLAAATTFVASSVVASTVNVSVSDVNNSGDDVAFSVVNGSSQAISMITFDVSLDPSVNPMSRFNIPSNLANGAGVFNVGSSGTFQFIDTDGDGRNEQLKWTFGGAGLASGDSFSFNAWIQYLNSQTLGGLKGGIDDAAARLHASVMFADGSISSSFFTSTGVANGVGSGTVSIAQVPLPASALLLLGGLAGIGAMRRRKKAA